MTEAQLQAAVIEMARTLGWLTAHFRPALTERGWRTPVSGDGKGFPDLILVRGERLIAAELKSDVGAVSVEQDVWLGAFRCAGALTAVWRPRDWTSGGIESELRRRETASQEYERRLAS